MVTAKFWTTRNYVLAALAGTLAATVVVIAFSVALRPARISFSILHASNCNDSAVKGGIWYLNLTIAAANASRKRAAVRYLTVFVDLKNSSATWNKIPTQIYARPPAIEYLPPGMAPAIINAGASVSLGSGSTVQDFVGNLGLTVVVETRVRSRVAWIRTRLYEIKASCPHVFFVLEGAQKPPETPIDCVLVR